MFSSLESWLPLVGGLLLFVAAVVLSVTVRQGREPAEKAPTMVPPAAAGGEDPPDGALATPPFPAPRARGRLSTPLALVAAITLPVALALAGAAAFTSEQGRQEARLVAAARAVTPSDPRPLVELGSLRQAGGNLEQAADTWGLILKLWGDRALDKPLPELRTYGDLARFHLQRVRRMQHQAWYPPEAALAQVRNQVRQPSLEGDLRAALASVPGAQVVVQQPLDLDGDLEEEVFVAASVPQTKALKLLVLRWDRDRNGYRVQWQGQTGPSQFSFNPGHAGYGEVIIADPQHVRPVVRLISNGKHIIRVF